MARGKQIIKSFEAKELRKRSLGVRFADELTGFFGSIGFFVFNIFFFAAWILVNTGKLPIIAPFDPYPFVLLITFVSLEAIMLSVVVLMSQNRAGFISSLREEIHLQVNLIAEREITKSLWLLKKVAEKQGVRVNDKELDKMLNRIDETYIESKLTEQLIQQKPEPLKVVTEPIKKVASEVEKSFRQ